MLEQHWSLLYDSFSLSFSIQTKVLALPLSSSRACFSKTWFLSVLCGTCPFFFCILIKRMGVRLKSKRGKKKKEPCTETLKKELLSPFKYSLLQPCRWGGYKKDLPLGTFIRCWSGSTSWISCEGVFWEIAWNTHLEPITRVSQGLLFFVYYYCFYIANQKSTWPVYAPYSYSHFETPSLD